MPFFLTAKVVQVERRTKWTCSFFIPSAAYLHVS